MSPPKARWLEIPTFAPTCLYIITDQALNAINGSLEVAWNAVGSTFPMGYSAFWLIVIILYGTLVSNTWRRCAVMTGAMGLIPISLAIFVEVYQDWPTPLAIVAMYLTTMGCMLACANPAIVYNVHRQEVLRDQVRGPANSSNIASVGASERAAWVLSSAIHRGGGGVGPIARGDGGARGGPSAAGDRQESRGGQERDNCTGASRSLSSAQPKRRSCSTWCGNSWNRKEPTMSVE